MGVLCNAAASLGTTISIGITLHCTTIHYNTVHYSHHHHPQHPPTHHHRPSHPPPRPPEAPPVQLLLGNCQVGAWAAHDEQTPWGPLFAGRHCCCCCRCRRLGGCAAGRCCGGWVGREREWWGGVGGLSGWKGSNGFVERVVIHAQALLWQMRRWSHNTENAQPGVHLATSTPPTPTPTPTHTTNHPTWVVHTPQSGVAGASYPFGIGNGRKCMQSL